MDNAQKRHLFNLVRVGVTLGAVGWVLLKIDWRDRLTLADKTVLRGRVQQIADGFLVLEPDGTRHEVRVTEAAGRDALQPGFVTLFQQIRWGWLAVGVAAYPLAIMLGALRWLGLMRAHQMDPGFVRSLKLTWMGFFWSLVFPGVTGGDVVKAVAVARTAERRAVSVLTVFLDRVIGIIALAILSGIVILFNLRNAELRTVSTGILVFIAAAVAGGLLFFSRRLRRWFGLAWLLGVLPFQSRVSQLDDALFHYRYHKRTMIAAFVVSVFAHIVNVGAFYFAGRSLGLPVAWHHYFVFIPVALIVAALPISFGGIGVLEYWVARFLSLGGVGATTSGALALCVLYRVMTIIVGLPGAVVRMEDERAERSAVGDQRSEAGHEIADV